MSTVINTWRECQHVVLQASFFSCISPLMPVLITALGLKCFSNREEVKGREFSAPLKSSYMADQKSSGIIPIGWILKNEVQKDGSKLSVIEHPYIILAIYDLLSCAGDFISLTI